MASKQNILALIRKLKEKQDKKGKSSYKSSVLESMLEELNDESDVKNELKLTRAQLHKLEKLDKLDDLIREVQKIKLEVPAYPSEMKISNIKEFVDQFIPKSVTVANIKDISFPDINLQELERSIKELSNLVRGFPRIPQKLKIDEEEVIKAMASIVIPQPPPASPSFRNAGGSTQRGLVDADGHVQVDVLSGGGGGTLVADGAAVNAANTGQIVLGTDGSNYQVLATDSDGNLQVDILTGGGGGTQYTEDAVAAVNPIGTALNLVREDARAGSLTTTDGDNVAARGTNAGELYVKHVDSIPITSATLATAAKQDLLLTELQLKADLTETQPVSGTFFQATQPVSIATAPVLVAGTALIGKVGIDQVTANANEVVTKAGSVTAASLSTGTNSIGNVGIIPRTSGGMTIFRSLDIDETEEEVKATAGQLFSILAFNRTAAPVYLKFYNATAAVVVVGTTTPVLTIPVPANADSDVAGFIWDSPIGWAFGTAITVACTTGVADADVGAPGVNDCVINLGYA